MKFSGSNFQSWQNFDLEIEGLTVITGVSNRGKSALFRALQGLLRNEIAANQVRAWWEPKQKAALELTLKYGDHEIKARRPKDSSTTYRIDGKPFTSLARQIPEDLKKLGFSEIKVGEFTVDPIFSSQHDPLFLLEKKTYGPGLLNSILGAFGGTEKLELGKKQANLLITQKNSDAKTLSAEIADTNARVGKLQTLADKGNQIANEIHALEASARRLEARAAWTALTHQRMTHLARIADIGKRLEIPDTSEVEALQTKLAALLVVGPSQYRVQALAWIEAVLSSVSAGWSEIVKMYKKARALQDLVPLLESRDASTAKADAKGLNAIIGQIENLHSAASRLGDSIRLLEVVQFGRKVLGDLSQDRQRLEAEQAAMSKICPTCGSVLDRSTKPISVDGEHWHLNVG
jgi:energy-coupling factor transporter ATP-binding protein EcfA2